ncbi:hypothetical protein BALOs_1793 [Halobacteriovorax sp. BALOs_7]|nr:hypothetical protein BALOs_1793 [Halobacteriovorax sp. BALOs_7]
MLISLITNCVCVFCLIFTDKRVLNRQASLMALLMLNTLNN